MSHLIHKGTYQACQHNYTTNVKADHNLDPIDPTSLTPWQAAHGFSATAQGLEDTDALYTLVVVDAGYFFLHGVYVDIPGDNFDIKMGKV